MNKNKSKCREKNCQGIIKKASQAGVTTCPDCKAIFYADGTRDVLRNGAGIIIWQRVRIYPDGSEEILRSQNIDS